MISDAQGSTLQLQAANFTAQVAYSYPPFGSLGAASTKSINPFRYTGREASDNTGLYYYRARYYSPGQSRFIQEDPLGLSAGPNIYVYANNDPLDLIDPLGLCGEPTTGQIIEQNLEDAATIAKGEIQDAIANPGQAIAAAGNDALEVLQSIPGEGSVVGEAEVLGEEAATGLKSIASQLEEIGGGVPKLVPTSKGASQFIFPNGTVLRFDLQPGQYLGNQGPHINLQNVPGSQNPNIHVPLGP